MTASPQARHWRSAAAALAVVRRAVDVTRPELGRRLGLDSGPTSDLVRRLAAARLVSERKAPAARRGRPTTTLHAHPDGPVAVVVDLRHGDWRLGTADLDGEVRVRAAGRHDGASPARVVGRVRARVGRILDELDGRVVGIGVAVPGPAVDTRLVHATLLGWRDVDLARVSPDSDLTVVVANDATAAAVAEARLHVPPPVALLHVVVEVGVGGALVVGGVPAPSGHGLHGEFGHLPFGDPDAACPCGATGCWTVAFDAPQVARRAGRRFGSDPRGGLARLFTDPAPDPAARRTRDGLAADLGRGVAGLVNALDPELVTLGGLAPALRTASPQAFDAALHDGLMTVHRERPPRVAAALAGEDAALTGVALSVFDRVLDAQRLARWAGSVARGA